MAVDGSEKKSFYYGLAVNLSSLFGSIALQKIVLDFRLCFMGLECFSAFVSKLEIFKIPMGIL